ncbi:hypothetical protein DITRI_Ditri14bG0059100 [Diplodiscus trichospermus]
MKSQSFHDPLGVTTSWNSSIALCQWQAITCRRRHQRLTRLDLSHQRLGGTLSPHIGNFSFLRFINVKDNNFYGVIPPEIGLLSKLESLIIQNNSFRGTIPTNLTHCSNLIEFTASRNNLVGNIPGELGNLLKLEILDISRNNLSRQLPTLIGNISTLHIARDVGKSKRLVSFGLESNNFSSFIPPSFLNISSLEGLSLRDNQLSGSLPVNLGSKLPNLQYFIVGINNLSGSLPESLSNASKLEMLEVSSNHFEGKVSINFQNAKNLRWLNIESNNMGSGGAWDLDFITTLTNCSRLRILSIAGNQFGGLLPNSISNLSTTLEHLYLGASQITGTIPSGITNLVNLTALTFEHNQLTVTIPDSLSKLKNLQLVALRGNALTGTIPTFVGNLSQLTIIDLGNNLLEGNIPAEFGKCQNLMRMLLGNNRLTGSVPKKTFSVVALSVVLDLSNNLLNGSFPSNIGNLKTLVSLDISGNKFSSQIPSAVGSCSSLETIFGEKSFLWEYPSLFELLEKHCKARSVKQQFVWNDKLCGGIARLHLPLCHLSERKERKRTVPLKLILIVCRVLGTLFISLLLFCWLRNKVVKVEPSSAFGLGNSILMVSFQQLLRATDAFASVNLIGQGSFGSVYKENLDQKQEQNVIAVKVMDLQEEGPSKSFLTKCKTLGNVKLRNLVKIISACSSIDFQGNPFKALIYEFMPNGSLERWLHEAIEENGISNGEPKRLNFHQKLNVAIDVASALDYLHRHCEVPVVHCDLKPSNIPLDHDMVAYVGDFGLARFLPKSMNNFFMEILQAVLV